MPAWFKLGKVEIGAAEGEGDKGGEDCLMLLSPDIEERETV